MQDFGLRIQCQAVMYRKFPVYLSSGNTQWTTGSLIPCTGCSDLKEDGFQGCLGSRSVSGSGLSQRAQYPLIKEYGLRP